jgi:hypothetical protein
VTGAPALPLSARSLADLCRNLLPWVFCLYAAATLLHFAHNAQYLADYPNLPSSWSRSEVYAAWGGVMAFGLLGYGLYAYAHRSIGRTIVGLYAILGFGGLLHYTRAPMHDHSALMNATIWAEAGAGALLLANVLLLGGAGARVVTKPSTIANGSAH